MANFSQTDLAQSFQPGFNNVSGAGILLWAGAGSSDTVTISLYNGLPNQSGSLLASASGTGTQGTWIDLFWTPVSVTAGTTYYLVFDGNGTLGIAGDTTDPYPRGMTFANPGFQAFPSFDYTFRTYSDAGEQSSVPEPATWALAAGGLLVMLRARRCSISG